MGLPKLWGNAPDGSGHGFVYSHVKSIYYNWAQKKLLSTKLDEIDTSILDLDTEKFDISKIIASTNITQSGYVMDGKTCSDALAQLNSNMQMQIYTPSQFITISNDVLSVYSACRVGNIVCIYGQLNGDKIDPNIQTTVAQLTALKPMGTVSYCMVHSGGITQSNMRITASGDIIVSVENRSAYYAVSIMYFTTDF